MNEVNFKILMVEDDGDWLDIYLNYLKDENYKIRSCRTINQALDHLEKEKFDVVVTDLKMIGFGDEFGGFKVLEKAKQIQPNSSVIVITCRPS